jgi:hypothetical protein
VSAQTKEQKIAALLKLRAGVTAARKCVNCKEPINAQNHSKHNGDLCPGCAGAVRYKSASPGRSQASALGRDQRMNRRGERAASPGRSQASALGRGQRMNRRGERDGSSLSRRANGLGGRA